MSLAYEEQYGLNQHAEERNELQKKLKISYTREFLLSVSELDACKNLPSGFDKSILSSEYGDVFRVSGSLSSQSYRHNEYSSSPPTRGDTGNYYRGIHGRWDSRSSGRSDRDSDSQSDRDSDSGRRYSNQSRRPWQVPEHDGLLGSGSFPRPTGYAAAGASVLKFRSNDHSQPNRSNEPYHPPRPYKAVPHSRRETKDSYNDETFGSSECTSEDRAEEERKRRASFELMRKEQQKAFQEKQKLNPEKRKDDYEISELMEDPKEDKRLPNKGNESDGPVIQPASNNDSDKSSFPSPAPVSRPLVPPGFSSNVVEKNIGTKSLSHPQPSEISNELEGSLFHAKGNRLLSGTSNNQEEKQSSEQMDSREQQFGSPSTRVSVNNQGKKILNLSSDLDVSSEAVGMDTQYHKTSKLSEAFGASEDSDVIELDAEDVTGSKVVSESSPTHSTSILDKLFGSALTLNGVGSSSLIEISNELEGSLFHAKGNRLLSGTSNNQEEKQSSEQMDSREQQFGSPSTHVSVNNQGEKILNFSSDLDVSSEVVGMDTQYHKTSKLSEAFGASEDSDVIELDAEDVTGSKVVSESSPTHSTSILDKLFGSALTLNGVGSSSLIEHHDVKADDTWSPHTVPSSKFAQWFFEEEKKPIDSLSSGGTNQPVADFSSSRTNKLVDDLTSGRPNDLLSLIVGEKSGSCTFDATATEIILPSFPLQGSGLAGGHMTSNLMPVTAENIDKLEAVSAVLTCEDLEQSILSEITNNGSILQPNVQGWSGSGVKTEQQKADIDDHASQHLLSLLQKGAGLSTNLGIISSDKPQNTEVENLGTAEAENISNAGKPLILETLFGTAFMKELQSVGTLTSGQRVPVGSMRADVSDSPFPVMDDDLLVSTADITSHSHDSSILASNQRQRMKSERIEEQFLGFAPQKEVNSSQLQTGLGSKLGGFDGSVDIQLPEEDSLIMVSDPLNLQNFVSARNTAKAELLSTPETTVDIAERLAALNSVYRDERPITGSQEGSPFLCGPFDMREPDIQYHKIHALPSSPQLHPSQLNNAGPMFHQLDSHPTNVNAQMKFTVPENIIHHDSPNHQFRANLLCPPFHHPSSGLTSLDPNPQNPMLQQMHISGNFPPPHLLRGFPRGVPLPPHPNSQVTGIIQEPNPMQGFPFGQRQSNFGGPGIPQQAPDVNRGTHHPETLQRLIEMDLRSNSKPIHPFATAGHSEGIYGHKLGMGFGYR